MSDKDYNGVFITIPAKIGSSHESVRHFEAPNRDGGEPHKLAEITLPKGCMVNGEDVSYYKLVVRDSQLDPGGQRHRSTHSLLLPEVNRQTGEEWNVRLTRDFGGTNPHGVWEPDVKEVVCTSTELKTAMREQYEGYKSFKQEQRSAEEPQKAKQPKEADGRKNAVKEDAGADLGEVASEMGESARAGKQAEPMETGKER